MTLSELYRDYAQHVYRFSYWLCGNAADAEDITSETFVRALVGTSDIKVATVKAYLFTIARNVFLQQKRRSRPHAELDESLADDAPDPLELAESDEQLAALKRALMTLSEPDRSALLMRASEGLPYRDIAVALGISLSAAKVKVHRARLRLSELMNRRKRK